MHLTESPAHSYTDDLLAYHRRRTRVVYVGEVGVGGDHPIRIQSMTTTLTKDVEATVAQTERLVRAGCEIVRVTTPTPDDARCLKDIRRLLASRDIRVPLVADIHFSPLAAMVAAEYADKVRVNPGNYVDSRKFAQREYTDTEYRDEVERMAERFTPLVLKCKQRGIAMRIGTNHGSLSDRIMNRFGDTPEGMVESALEFVRVCEANEYYDVILSMKASNPKVMIAAYRLLAARMDELGMNYPFHLGVTEAGNGEDGRIKSAIGIGSLLEDGIGDTIRVSLTEEPEAEIPVAQSLARRYPRSEGAGVPTHQALKPAWDPFHFDRRHAASVPLGQSSIGGTETISVIATAPEENSGSALLRWASPAGKRQPKPEGALVSVASSRELDGLSAMRSRISALPGAELALIASSDQPALLCRGTRAGNAIDLRIGPLGIQTSELDLVALEAMASRTTVILTGVISDDTEVEQVVTALFASLQILVRDGVRCGLSLNVAGRNAIYAYRFLVLKAASEGVDAPILLEVRASAENAEENLLDASITLGSLLCDGIGDAVAVDTGDNGVGLAFNILQAAGARSFKTDYVACPSCGRTLFDLQETTERIKARTSHLVGVKLAIMGCIVNGPGEMADADFGYVGGAPGKVNLYVGRDCVEKGVPAKEADDRLIALIKSHGKWQEEEPD